MQAPRTVAVPRTIRLLVARDAPTAEEWQRVLGEADIEAWVEIDDAQRALPGQRPLNALGWAPQEFVYPLRISTRDRESAMRALIDGGWDGRTGLIQRGPAPAPRASFVRAMVVVGVTVAIVAARVVLG
jgi:hypothetical protein